VRPIITILLQGIIAEERILRVVVQVGIILAINTTIMLLLGEDLHSKIEEQQSLEDFPFIKPP
jgi:hypothetical protein